MLLSPGARLGPYEIIAPVGAGGMGEVFKARDTRLERSVAIKVLPAELAQNAQLKLRFEREAKAISQLSHPNICTLYDVGDGYLVMELLEGETVADRLTKGPLPIDQVLKIGAQIANALDSAHKAGIVHRDLKPSNVMLTKSGAKLLDFGLAKDQASGLGPQPSVVDTEHKPLTEEGTVVGTYQYMAPEQLAGERADARTDIFALGAVLYEMATGRRAFDGKTKTSIITSIVSREPSPISAIRPMTPPAFEHVVRKCLSKDPDERWQSAHDIATQLQWIVDSGSSAGLAVPVLRTRRFRERLLWIAALVAVAAAALAVATKLHLGETPRQYRFTIPMADAAYRGGSAVQMSPDGQTLYFRAIADNRHFQVFRRRLDELTATPMAGTESAYAFMPSADGKSLLLSFSGGVTKRISVNGGPLDSVVEGPAGISSDSPDGTILFGADAEPVRRLLPDRTIETITTLDKALGETGHTLPYFLPDGKSFLFLAVTRDAQRGTIHRVLCGTRIGSKDITRVGEITSRVEYALGDLFFVRGGTLMAQPFNAGKFKFTGEAVPVAEDVQFNSRLTLASFSVASNGTIVYQPNAAPQRLSMTDATGRSLSSMSPSGMGGPRFALFPDRSRAVLAIADHRAGLVSLWVYGLNRESATRLTFSPANENNPVISRDGSRVFFSSDAQGTWDIYEAPVDGSVPARLVVAAPVVQTPNDVSPDGKFLLYTSNETAPSTRQDLYVVPLSEGGKPRPFLSTPAIENEGTFSPDGKWVAYNSVDTGTFQVFVRPFPGPGPARQVSTKGGRGPRFSPDGRRLYYADDARLMVAEFHADGSTSEPALAFDNRDEIISFQPLAGDRFMVLSQNGVDASPPARVIVGWHP
ncbi:MAG TPA: protein kinase [Thermoanaerobaculia bacterium]|nr:protein kinase [Thermoanaerobaculia bacterium]